MKTLNADEINAVSGGSLDRLITVAEIMYQTLKWSSSGYSRYVESGRRIEHSMVW
ncbi:hypothetical protein Q4561_11530 [Alteromonas sp. 1_MG-2023]|uniref:hypothetical protein n=1 Tax=Alteromonas sp. 1_MG-2023 TaxID=3062669 RepID=UPI0026E25EF5|nr:hypothetical protein [Alteromonas sp. 1_MG-2023]MDO6567690.1 hypothetical protein [Alteromonas sp. 1_MG-2023]